MKNPSKIAEREQWFKDHVGKRLWRNRASCNCESCTNVWLVGIEPADEFHAMYLCDTEGSYNAEGSNLRYFATKEERDEYEKTL